MPKRVVPTERVIFPSKEETKTLEHLDWSLRGAFEGTHFLVYTYDRGEYETINLSGTAAKEFQAKLKAP